MSRRKPLLFISLCVFLLRVYLTMSIICLQLFNCLKGSFISLPFFFSIISLLLIVLLLLLQSCLFSKSYSCDLKNVQTYNLSSLHFYTRFPYSTQFEGLLSTSIFTFEIYIFHAIWITDIGSKRNGTRQMIE